MLSILSIDEFFSLEQSSYYHQLAISLVKSLDKKHLEAIGIQKESFIKKMKDVNYWLTSTDKKLIAMGDTSVVSMLRKIPSLITRPKKWQVHSKKQDFQ